MITISNLIPIGHSFQRLYDSALDDICIYDTVEDAKNIISNNSLAYVGQLIFIKEYRNSDVIADDKFKSALYYIDNNKDIVPVCLFDYNTICVLLEILNQAEYKKDMTNELNKLKDELLGRLIYDCDMVIISRQQIPKDMFNNYGATFVDLEVLEDGTYKHTYIVNGTFELCSSYYYKTDYFHVFNKYEAIYVKIPFAKAQNINKLFNDCAYLEEFYFPYLDLSGLLYMEYVLSKCPKLNPVLKLNWNLSNGKEFQYAFANTQFEYIDTTNFNTINAIYMYSMFQNSKAKCINLSGLNTSNVTTMDSMFSGCSNLEELDVSCLDMSAVEDLANMFASCTSLKSLDISSWNTVRATNFSGMFGDCTKLKEIIGIETVPTIGVIQTNGMFMSCDSLVSLDLSNWFLRPTSVKGMFYNCTILEELDLSGWNLEVCGDVRQMFYGCRKLKKLNISGWKIRPGCQTSNFFGYCTSLTRENVITDGCDEYTIQLIDSWVL